MRRNTTIFHDFHDFQRYGRAVKRLMSNMDSHGIPDNKKQPREFTRRAEATDKSPVSTKDDEDFAEEGDGNIGAGGRAAAPGAPTSSDEDGKVAESSEDSTGSREEASKADEVMAAPAESGKVEIHEIFLPLSKYHWSLLE